MFYFQINQEYDREDLLAFVGSKQQQSGIIWGPNEPGCVIVTSGGKHGKSAGYQNKNNDDGTWSYVGQGSKGDQDPNRFSNSLLTNKQRSVLLFITQEPSSKEATEKGNRRKKYRFEGIFEVLSWDFEEVLDGSRAGDQVLVFNLIPSKSIFSGLEIEASTPIKKGATLTDLLKRIQDTQKKEPTKEKLTVQQYKERSQLIKAYALLRANGICELCEKPAPFISKAGVPFLEVHHIFRLADDGPDAPENVAALCPNCHKEVHYGSDVKYFRTELSRIILEKQENIMEYEI